MSQLSKHEANVAAGFILFLFCSAAAALFVMHRHDGPKVVEGYEWKGLGEDITNHDYQIVAPSGRTVYHGPSYSMGVTNK